MIVGNINMSRLSINRKYLRRNFTMALGTEFGIISAVLIFFSLKDDFGIELDTIYKKCFALFLPIIFAGLFAVVRTHTLKTNKLVCVDEATGLCIGEVVHNGCRITKRDPKYVKATINFSLTESNICSIVFPTYVRNWTQFAENNKRLFFSVVSSSSKPIHAEIELPLQGNVQFPILITDKETNYSVPLTSFSNIPAEFAFVPRICFLFRPSRKGPPEKYTVTVSSPSIH